MPRSLDEYVPQLAYDRRPFVIWLTVASLAALLTAMVIVAPLARANGYQTVAVIIYGAFSRLCHQIPERSFFIAGQQWAICSRCAGLYIGFTTAIFCYPLVRSLRRTDTPERRWLFLAALPILIDFSLGYFGIWQNTHLSRFLTGALFGSVAVFYVVPGLIQLNLKDLRELFHRKAPAIQ